MTTKVDFENVGVRLTFGGNEALQVVASEIFSLPRPAIGICDLITFSLNFRREIREVQKMKWPHALLVAASFFLSGHSSLNASQHQFSCDSQIPVKRLGKFFKNEIPRSQFTEIDRLRRADSLAMLGDEDIMRMNSAKLRRIGAEDVFSDNENIYLIRVKRASEGGAFSVFSDGVDLLVLHGDLGLQQCEVPIQATIIVKTKFRLGNIFSGASFSQ